MGLFIVYRGMGRCSVMDDPTALVYNDKCCKTQRVFHRLEGRSSLG